MPNYNRHNDRNLSHQNNQLPPPKIILDYTKEPNLFGEIAKKWAKKLGDESRGQVNKSSQIRQFYDKVLDLYEKSVNLDEIEYKRQIYPFVVMLNSKATYAKTRNKVSKTFEIMINSCVEQANTKKGLENFKLFFEAVLGFYPKQ